MRQEIETCLQNFLHGSDFSFHAEIIELDVWSITIYNKSVGIVGYAIYTTSHTPADLIREVSKIPYIKEMLVTRKTYELINEGNERTDQD